MASEAQISGDDPAEMDLLRSESEDQQPLLGLPLPSSKSEVNKWAIACLLLQHVSSTFGSACYDFASFLFLIEVFKDTLVPASLVGLFTKLTGLLLSGLVGGLVDRVERLKMVRSAIAAEKIFKLADYACFIVLFGPLYASAQSAFHLQSSTGVIMAVWAILILTVVCSGLLGLANTAMTVAIERDWVMTIASNDPVTLTLLNTYIRRIDLLSKLMAPLFVSLLTTLGGYSFTTWFLLALVGLTYVLESWWIGVVYRRFPILASSKQDGALDEEGLSLPLSSQGSSARSRPSALQKMSEWARGEIKDWAEFARLPVFATSISISVIYLTTLSYDGTFIAYVKAARGWDDNFIAIMRGICVLTGLMGTWVMPRLESRIGIERAGHWSIWSEVICLAPVMFSFFYGTGRYGEHGETWNTIVLFGGIALSRIGLYSFDLCQLKELQLALDSHPRRNRLTALQLSLSNLFDLLKYAVTLAASTPQQFKWTAVVSWLAVLIGALSYGVYVRKIRGHLLHLDWFKKST